MIRWVMWLVCAAAACTTSIAPAAAVAGISPPGAHAPQRNVPYRVAGYGAAGPGMPLAELRAMARRELRGQLADGSDSCLAGVAAVSRNRAWPAGSSCSKDCGPLLGRWRILHDPVRTARARQPHPDPALERPGLDPEHDPRFRPAPEPALRDRRRLPSQCLGRRLRRRHSAEPALGRPPVVRQHGISIGRRISATSRAADCHEHQPGDASPHPQPAGSARHTPRS
jgi:hypothetical protein